MNYAILFIIIVCVATSVIYASPVVIKADRATSFYRLQSNLHPIHYDLMIDTKDFTTNSIFIPLVFSGEVDITFDVLEITNVVELNCKNLTIEEKDVRLMSMSAGQNYQLSSYQYLDEYEICQFHFDAPLLANQRYHLLINFSGAIRTDLRGLYRSSYTVNNSLRYLLVTQFEATYARNVFPCFDEPGYRSTFTLKLQHLTPFHARSNMPAVSSAPANENYTLTTFATTESMPTYLLAFVVSSFDIASATNRFEYNVLAPENQIDSTGYALQFAQDAMKELESLLQHQYQLPKLDLVAVPDFNFGAMENWGLVTFRKVYLLYTPGVTSHRTQQSITNLISHELAHMWFGNEVTPEWWSYVWLSEGLASYFESYVASRVETSWRIWDQFVVLGVQSALAQDHRVSTRPMTQEVSQPADINNLFDYVAYAKSGSVFRMFQNVIGMDNFLNTLRDYITQRSFNSTNPEYFYNSLRKYTMPSLNLPTDIGTIFDSWATTPGYPVVNVHRDYANNKIHFTQKRFFSIDEIVDPTQDDRRYYVPINYIAQNDNENNFEITTSNVWLTPNTQTTTIDFNRDDEWIIVNKQQTGYYRVNYDEDNWRMIIDALNGPEYHKVHVLNRAQLIDDSTHLAKEDEIEYGTMMSVMHYLENEVDYIPWSAAYKSISFLIRVFGGNENYPRFESFLRNMTQKVFDVVGLDGDDTHLARLSRDYTGYLACFSGYDGCVDIAVDYVNRAISSNFEIPEAIQTTVFCAAVKHDLSMTNRITSYLTMMFLNIANRAQFEDYIYRVITGLGCTTDTSNINTAIDLSLISLPINIITRQDRSHIFNAVVTGSYEGAKAGLYTIYRRWGEVSNSYISIAHTIDTIAPRIVSQEMVEIFSDIISTYSSFFDLPARTAIENAQKTIINNMGWVSRNSDEVADWLIENDFDFPPPPRNPGNDGDGGGATSIGISSYLLIIMLCLRKYLSE